MRESPRCGALWTGSKKSGYPKYRAAVAAMRLNDALGKGGRVVNGAEASRLRDLTVKWTVASLSDGSFKPGEERLLAEFISGAAYMLNGDSERLWDAVLNYKQLDPWVMKYVRGWKEVELAWNSRGNAYAYKVTEEGWKGFEKHLKLARTLLIEAWKLHPNYPEAPTKLIQVAMGGCAEGDESPRLWFKRAIAGQLDYIPAYYQYRWAIRPRWGGTLDDVFGFGVTCLQTRRFDTGIPWQFVEGLTDVTTDLSGDRRYWKLAETWPRLRIMCDGYAKSNFGPLKPAQWLTMKAAFGAQCEKYADAARILASLGNRVDKDTFVKDYPQGGPDGIKTVRSLGSANGQKMLAADKLLDAGKYSQAADAYKKLMAAPGNDSFAKAVLKDRLEAAGLSKAFAEGKWVDLKPRLDSHNWSFDGSVKIEKDGTLRAAASKTPLSAMCNVSFGDRYEIKGELEFAAGDKTYCGAGIVLDSGESPRRVYFNKSSNLVVAGYLSSRSGQVAQNAGVKAVNTFLIQQWDDNVTVLLNGKRSPGCL